MAVELLHYRPWRGEYRSPAASIWPIARVSLALMFRRKLFWGLYVLGLSIFLLYFFGQFLLAWAADQLSESSVPVMGLFSFPLAEPSCATGAVVSRMNVRLLLLMFPAASSSWLAVPRLCCTCIGTSGGS